MIAFFVLSLFEHCTASNDVLRKKKISEKRRTKQWNKVDGRPKIKMKKEWGRI